MKELAFDRVLLTTGKGREELTVETFLALPLTVRVKHILSRSVEFYRGKEAVDQKLALASLRRLNLK
jgi:hypothetical protein